MIERLTDSAADDDSTRVDTPARLLEAAIDTFADKGYHNATVAEICSAAGANVAAVNYHFGSKQKLYVAAWRKAFQDSVAAHPPDGGVPSGASARRRFRARISSIMHRVLDPASREFEIVHHEMNAPTGLLAEVMRECIEPLREGMKKILVDLLNHPIDPKRLDLCQRSIIAQCMHFTRHRLLKKRAFGHVGITHGDDDVEALVDHVVRFSLAGLRAVGRQAAREATHD